MYYEPQDRPTLAAAIKCAKRILEDDHGCTRDRPIIDCKDCPVVYETGKSNCTPITGPITIERNDYKLRTIRGSPYEKWFKEWLEKHVQPEFDF